MVSSWWLKHFITYLTVFSLNSCLHLSPSNFLFPFCPCFLFIRCSTEIPLNLNNEFVCKCACVCVRWCLSYADDQSTSRCILILSRSLKLHYNHYRHSEIWNVHVSEYTKCTFKLRRMTQPNSILEYSTVAVDKLIVLQVSKPTKWNHLHLARLNVTGHRKRNIDSKSWSSNRPKSDITWIIKIPSEWIVF